MDSVQCCKLCALWTVITNSVDVFCGLAGLEQIDRILSLYMTWLHQVTAVQMSVVSKTITSVAYWYDEHVCNTNVAGAECTAMSTRPACVLPFADAVILRRVWASRTSVVDYGSLELHRTHTHTYNAPLLALHCGNRVIWNQQERTFWPPLSNRNAWKFHRETSHYVITDYVRKIILCKFCFQSVDWGLFPT